MKNKKTGWTVPAKPLKKKVQYDKIFPKETERIVRALSSFIVFAFSVVCISFVLVCAVGCKSTPLDSTAVGERNQFVLGQLDSTISSLSRELAKSNDEIGDCLKRSRDIEDGARRIKYLFGEYVKTVQRIQDANNRTIERLELLEKSLHDPSFDISGSDCDSGGGSLLGENSQD